ncbi:hypothetical protein C4D60_Mb02t00940 [Musa balbisiana]|uniref:Uncharacterized protein n=1 Tax=Musa balbisiana TaxID=52838 RepID=A0A4S8I7C3_MUSBA|nr:hypothetical protein C4D60_Mb02t00940 [Musa balbisiana]
MFCSRHLKLIYFQRGVYQKPFVHVAFVFGDLGIGLERIGNIERLGVPISGIRLRYVRLWCLCGYYPNGTRAESVMQFVKVSLICANGISINAVSLDTLVGFRRVSGKSSINFSIFGVTEASSLGMILLHRDDSICIIDAVGGALLVLGAGFHVKKAGFLFSMEPSHCKQRSPIFIKESSCGDPIVN